MTHHIHTACTVNDQYIWEQQGPAAFLKSRSDGEFGLNAPVTVVQIFASLFVFLFLKTIEFITGHKSKHFEIV